MSSFRLLVIADVHYTTDAADAASAPARRRCLLGCELVRRAIEDARRRGGLDAIALMGDLINDAHELWEVALLGRHVEMLHQAAGRADIAELLRGLDA